MDASVLLFDARAGQLNTPDGAWQFAVKVPRPPLDRWIGKLWELDGGCPPARARVPRGDISLIVNLGGRHAVVDSTHSQREHVFIVHCRQGATRFVGTEAEGRGLRDPPRRPWR